MYYSGFVSYDAVASAESAIGAMNGFQVSVDTVTRMSTRRIIICLCRLEPKGSKFNTREQTFMIQERIFRTIIHLLAIPLQLEVILSSHNKTMGEILITR